MTVPEAEQKAWIKRMILKYASLDTSLCDEDREWELENAANAIVEGWDKAA